jgi:hypothetical protein
VKCKLSEPPTNIIACGLRCVGSTPVLPYDFYVTTVCNHRLSFVTCVVVIFRDVEMHIFIFLNMKLYFKQCGCGLVAIFCMHCGSVVSLLGAQKSFCWW